MKFLNHLVMVGLVFASTVSVAKPGDLQAKIVGGSEATPGEFPFIVSLQGSSGHFCGGSLIRSNWVLTAAHCVKGASVKNVVIGLHDQKNLSKAEVIKPKRIIAHPLYNDNTADFDFALIELQKDSSYEPIAINTSEIEIPDGANGQIVATVAGWGATRENSYSLPSRLQKVDVPLVAHDLCSKNYKNTITSRMLCAGYPRGGKDSCQGDSGGPLVARGGMMGQSVLIGVVSWGEGCARANLPGVYAKVNAETTWIEQTAR
ncbi:MAG: trypsin [Bdellovibrio sp. ArHS]|uniref:S1 family serine peptidase n=1 Tax=Bdellovibrio sp. ArHS TaxID=1569284 RepID=UPI000583E23A|nr:serine protease [Bdellovibrio sp. ArHS]KHD87510.1 MAG: trypsin [Bdellovibrio sp. ArHS]